MNRFLHLSLALTFAIAAPSAAARAQAPAGSDLLPVRGHGGCSIFAQPTLFRWSGQPDGEGGPPGLDEPLASDRPDFTEASTTVGRRVVQLEMGYTYFADDDGPNHTHTHSYPELLARIGILAEWLEFRIAYNHATVSDDFGAGPAIETSGGEDLYLGFKLGLTPQEGILPEMALMPQWTVPSGADAFTAGEVLPGINWLYGWDINDFLSTAGSTQINKAIDDL